MTKSRALTLGLVACLGVVIAHAEVTIPEEKLTQAMYQGVPEQGRAGFKALVDARLADLTKAQGSSAADTLARRAVYLTLAVRALEAWEGAEAGLRVQGYATPDAALHDIAERVQQVDAYSSRVASAAAELPSDTTDAQRRAVKQSDVPVGRLMVKTAVLFKGTSMEQNRGSVLNSARRLTAVPATEAQFDAEHSLVETFNIQLTPPPPAKKTQAAPAPSESAPAAQAAPAEAVAPAADEAAVRTVVAAYVGYVARGDLARAKKLFVRGYWPKRTLRQLARRFEGSDLGDVGPLVIEPAGADTLDVTLDEVTLVDAAARDKVTFRLRSHVLLRRVGDRYRIAGIGAKKGAHR